MARKVINVRAVRDAIYTPSASRHLPIRHQQLSTAVLAERCVNSQRSGVAGNLEASK